MNSIRNRIYAGEIAGGADTVECLATASVDDLLALIKPFSR